jgi:hypothetical protein
MTTLAWNAIPHEQPFASTLWRSWAAPLTSTLLACCISCASAQGLPSTPSPTASATKSTPLSKNLQTLIAPSNPGWLDLSPTQQASLKPLAEHWYALDETRKRKWLAIAANYQTLAPTEQAKLHSRMTEWVSLSKQERNQARLNFSQSKQLTPTQKTATWDAYQSLSTEEKKKLAIQAPPKPLGAATAVKQTSPEKLSLVPAKHKLASEIPKTQIAVPSQVNRYTLLPQAHPPATPASTPRQ